MKQSCVFLVAAAMMLGAASPGAQAEVPFVGVNAGAPIWNGSILFTDAVAADIASSGCRFVRINFRIDGNPTWTSSHLAKYDTIIANARDHNLQVLGLICYEAVNGSQSEWNQNYDTTGVNPYTTRFADNAWLLIDRYKNDVKVFEIWNEPDCWSVPPESNPLNPGGFYIWPKNYANILAETYKKCLSMGGRDFFDANGVSLSSGGLFAHDIGGSFSTSRGYMTEVYKLTSVWNAFEAVAGRRYPWSYFGYHFYLNQGSAVSTSELTSYFNDIRTMRNHYNDAAKVLVTEFGWGSVMVGEQLQAENLTNTYDYLRTRSDVDGVMWYQWNNDPSQGWGLVYSIGIHKPAYDALAQQCGLTPPPTAAFTASPLSGRAPLGVQFTSTSMGTVESYQWDFGDGGTSTAANPYHVFDESGIYAITLTVSGPGGSDSVAQPDLIAVLPPLVRGDFNGDGDVDGEDVDRFVACLTGPGSSATPPGCEAGPVTLPPPVVSWEGADTVEELPETIAAGDMIAGLAGAKEAGGFHSVTPGGDSGGMADLTDGDKGTNVEAVLLDYPGGATPNTADPLNRALQVRYDFAAPRDIDRIHVFAANVTNPGDGRVFQNYDVHYLAAGQSDYRILAENVLTGPFGRSNALAASSPDYLGATLTRIAGQAGKPAAMNVASLRFVFYPVADLNGLFLDEFSIGEPGDTDGQREAFVSTILKEIDVFEFADPPPVVENIADLDGDLDVDQADFGLLQRCLSGPEARADPGCFP